MVAATVRFLVLGTLVLSTASCAHFVRGKKSFGPWEGLRVVSSRLVATASKVSIDAASGTARIKFDVKAVSRCKASRKVGSSNSVGLAIDIAGPLSLLEIGLAIMVGSASANGGCQQSGGCQAGVVIAGSGALWGLGAMTYGRGHTRYTSTEVSPVRSCHDLGLSVQDPAEVTVTLKSWLNDVTLRRGYRDFELKGVPLRALKAPSLLEIRTKTSRGVLDLGKAFSKLVERASKKAP